MDMVNSFIVFIINRLICLFVYVLTSLPPPASPYSSIGFTRGGGLALKNFLEHPGRIPTTLCPPVEMDSARSKLIVKRQGSSVVEPSEIDLTVAKAVFELQNSSNELAADLRNLQIYGAREVDMSSGRNSRTGVAFKAVSPANWKRNSLISKLSLLDSVVFWPRTLPGPSNNVPVLVPSLLSTRPG